MKRKHIYMLGLSSLIIMSGCEKLDRDIVTALNKQQVITSYAFTSSRVSAIYSRLPNGFNSVGGAMLADAGDDAEFTLETSSVQYFNTGGWNAYTNPDGGWSKYYRGIRLANQFLASADSVDLDYLKLDPDSTQQQVYQTKMAEIKNWKYEVRFLRAFFYFELIKRYGGVPLFSKVFSPEDNTRGLKRNTLAECIQFIVKECDLAANVLPLTYESNNLGRATKGAALALKSRVLLYAASDLFNDASWASGYTHPELIALPSGNRSERWKAAADAAKAVIDLAGAAGYTLDNSYVNLFHSFKSSEIILVRRNGSGNSFEKTNYPIGYDMGNSGTTPSQNLVDAYEVKVDATTSVPFDWNNPAQAADPYANRDPRLAMTVLTNKTMFKGRPVECWIGGLDGKGQVRATKTGYYLKKYVDPDLDLQTGQTSVHSWIIFRLAEMYLNYVEALNEYDPGNPNIKFYYNKVRKRPDVNMPALPAGLSQSDVREKIHHERRIEFAFEGFRFWDLRRWMKAPKYLSTPLRGVEIKKTGNETFTYNPVNVENRVFKPKMYFYPIPQQELLKVPGLYQNPLW